VTVTFIIITYNSENFISKCINSILIQSHKNFEIIIIDNNSNDSTLDIVNSFKGDTPIKIISNDENMGYGNAINQNIKNISSKFIAVLNADVYLEKNWTNNLIKSFIDDDLSVMASGPIYSPDNSIQSIGGCMDQFGAVFHINSLLRKTKNLDNQPSFFFIDGSIFLIKTDFFKKNYFDPNLFLYYEDVDLSWRIHMLKYKINFVSTAIAYHDIGHKNKEMTSKKFLYTARNRLYVCQKNLPSKKLFKVIPSIVFLLLLNSIYYNFKFKTVSYTFNFFKAWFWNIKNIKTILFQRKNSFKINLLTDTEFDNLIISKSIEIDFFKNKILFKPK
jgi:GT2 family glycosyltransferase